MYTFVSVLSSHVWGVSVDKEEEFERERLS